MATESTPVRVNIYLDDPNLKREIKIAAAKHRVTVSAFCVEAIRQRLRGEQSRLELAARESENQAARALDQLRLEIGRIGIPVGELIDEGRKG